MTVLNVDADELAACVSCGLCLPHCPTYRVTGDESASPRGRIAAMRKVEAGLPLEGSFTEFMDLCVQCRGCEAACPSSVPFGRLVEGVMDAWQRSTHAAALRVIEATGTGVALPGDGGDCCGALHVHAGLADGARALARRVMRSMPGDAPIIVDSAGCGAALKDYGHLLG